MSNMTIKQMEAVVKDYIDADFPGEYRYALMLNGKWGSGKTYFIQKNIIQSYIREGKPVQGIYVSLNGLKDRNEIIASLISSIASKKFGKNILFLSNLTTFGIEAFVERFVGGTTAKKLDKFINLSSFKEGDFFFVFDDLERCLMPLEESLGFISSFVEQYKAKVIILANEEEIKNGFAQRMDYYQFAVNKDLKIDLSNKENELFTPVGNSIDKKEKEIDGIDLLALMPRAEKISETLGSYNRIKEKVVGETIDFTPQMQEIICNILEHTLFRDLINDKKDFSDIIYNIMKENDHQNIRTLFFSIEVFNKFFTLFTPLKEKEFYFEFCREWFLIVLRVSCQLKSGGKDVDWSQRQKIDSVNFKENNKNIWERVFAAFTSVKVIHDYIFRSEFVEKEVEEEAAVFYDLIEKSVLDKNDPLKTDLGNYHIKPEEKVQNGIRNVEKKLFSGGYRPEQFCEVLSMFCKLKANGFDIDLDRCVQYMKNQLKDRQQIFLKPEAKDAVYAHYSRIEGFDLFEKCLRELQTVKVPDPKIKKIQSILSKGEGWGEELEKYAIEQFKTTGDSYFKVLDYATAQQWINLLLNSKAKDIDGFRGIVLDNNPISEKEAEILQEIQQNVQNKLDQDPPKDKIIVMQLRWLLGNIKDKLDPPKKA